MCLALLFGLVPIYGNGGIVHSAAPEVEPQLVSGYYHYAGLATDGTVWGWGGNEFGGLADGTAVNRVKPVAAKGMTGVASIAAGVRQTFAVKQDSTVWAWGSNNFGQLGDGTTTNQLLPVQIAIDDVALLSGGIGYHTLALKKDGSVWAWGRNDSGQLGDGTLTNRSVPAEVPGLSGMIAVSAGGYHSIALKADGTVWAWGLNTAGEMGNGTESAAQSTPIRVSGLDHVIAISAGNYHNLALKENGTVWAWGDNGQGRLGDGTTTKRIVPVQVQGLTGMTAVSAGGFHSVALKDDGTVWAWGHNNLGQVGDGTKTQRNAPVQLPGLADVVQVAAGAFHSGALRKDGSFWGWGFNDYGQLGNGTVTDSLVPVQSAAWLDGTPPDISSGTISASAVTTNSATLTWAKATDNMSEQSSLQYRVYRSFKNNIQTVADIESKGIAVNNYTADIASLQLTDLLDGMPYYFNVIVKDKAGKKTAYTMQQVVTVAIPTYSVIYRGNGNTGGKVPVDDYYYHENEQAEILGNPRALVRAGYTFAKWNTAADGTGTSYAEGDQATIGKEDLVLYAQWTKNPTYKVLYDGNGETGGSGPIDGEEYEAGEAATVLSNDGGFVKLGHSFAGWNTEPDGTGTAYAAGETLTMAEADTTLYAQWTKNPTYSVIYDANGADSGYVPTDSGAYEEGAEVRVLGNIGGLAKAGHTFAGWTMEADGSGKSYQAGDKLTMGTAAVTLYAKWDSISGTDPDPGPDPVAAPKLTALRLSAGVWSKPFASDKTEYTISLAYDITSIRVAVGAANERQSVTASVYGEDGTRLDGPVDVTGGAESAALTLGKASLSLQIVVIAEDGKQLVYRLLLQKGKAPDPIDPGPNPPENPPLNPPENLPISPTPAPNFKLTIAGTEQSGLGIATLTGRDMNLLLRTAELTARLAESAAGSLVTITTPEEVRNVAVVFDGAALNALKARGAAIELHTAKGSYTLPFSSIPEEAAGGETFRLTVSQTEEGTALLLSQSAGSASLTVVSEPVTFELSRALGDEVRPIDRFLSYVKRELPLPDGVDPVGVTAVVIEKDGVLRPVPTEIENCDGRYYAIVRSLSNSAYALVRQATPFFSDLTGHWAQEAVADLAARLVVNGYDGNQYRPNAAVSRAEFAAMLVRALGLPTAGDTTVSYTDVKTGAWYAGTAQQAAAYDLLRGDSEGRFRPDEKITREEALVVLMRALKLAGYAYVNETDLALSAFADSGAVHSWARQEVTEAVQAGLAQGSGGKLSPSRAVTRAEAAVLLRRMLINAGLIDSRQ